MKHISDIIAVIILSLLLFGAAAYNIIQPDRPVYSEEEKRELAEMPEFSLSSLADGSYFSGIDSFVSDTFIFRDTLISAANKIKTCYGITDSSTIVIIDGREEETGGESEIFIPEIETSAETETKQVIVIGGETEPETETEIQTETDESSSETDAETEPVTETETEAETNPPLTGIKLSKDVIYLSVGEKEEISAAVYPEELDGKYNVSWENSNTKSVNLSVID